MSGISKNEQPEQPCPVRPEFPDLIPHEWTQRPWYVRVVLALVGLVLVVLGMLGWLMPVIPGFFLVPIGVVLIAASSRWAATYVNALDRRLPTRCRRVIHAPLHRHRPKPKRTPEPIKSVD